MKEKRYFAWNRMFNVFLLFGVLFMWGLFYILLVEKEFSAFCCLGIVFLGGTVIVPCGYVFDQKGVTIVYLFFQNEYYLWNNIHRISVEIDHHLDKMPFFGTVFQIDGRIEGKKRAYMEGKISKNFRTKRLIEKYWDGEVEGYFFEDVKKWQNRRKEKRGKAEKQYLTDTIVPMEREARAMAREVLSPIVEQAAYHDIALRVKYIYMTSKGEEHSSRPKEGYGYAALIEFAYNGEKDPERIVQDSITLLRVRLGKAAYRGVINETAKTELIECASALLQDILQNGINSCCAKD